jgi:hypothetical protein
VAVGWSGIAALRDWRGECDMHGKVLEITLEAIVDEITRFESAQKSGSFCRLLFLWNYFTEKGLQA